MALYTHTSGSGSDLVLVHGWSLHGGIWDRFVPLLEPHFRVTPGLSPPVGSPKNGLGAPA